MAPLTQHRPNGILGIAHATITPDFFHDCFYSHPLEDRSPACCSAQKPHVPTVVEACSEGGGGYAFTSYQRKHWEVREAWLTILGYMLLMQKACWSERSICLGICISCHGEVILLLGTLSHPPHHKDPTQIDQKCCRHAKQSIKAGQQAGSPRNENAACRPRMKVGAQRTWAYDSPGASSGTPVR